jgi:glutamate/aspartate transport system permease protein
MFEMDWQTLIDSRAVLLSGMRITLQITVVAILFGLAWVTVLAAFSLSSHYALRVLTQAYVSLFRSIPLVMLLWFFLIVPQFLKALFNLPSTADLRLVSALTAYSLLEAAFFCEIIRAGIASLPRGQLQAGHALGMTVFQTLRYVIFSQAFRAMVPLTLTQCIVIFQDASLVHVIGLGDFFRRVTAIGERDGTLVPILIVADMAYWSVTTLLIAITNCFRTRLAK